MSIFKTILCSALGAFVLSSCGSQSPYPGYEQSPEGVYYKFYSKGDGKKKVEIGDYVTVKLIRRIGKDSIVYDSRKQNPNGGTVEYRLDKPTYPSSPETGIAMMSVGDSASFYVFTDSLQKYMPNPDKNQQLKAGLAIIFDIKVVSVRSKEEAEAEMKKKYEEFMAAENEKIKMFKQQEPELLASYLKENKVTAKPTKDGLYYVETLAGTGPKAKVGSKVTVKYTGKFMDGNIFDASDNHGGQPFEFTLGNKEVIPGWDEGLQLMKKGGKATLIVPSKLAYDSIGIQDPKSGRYAIYPYTPLIFDVELVEVK